MTTFWNFSKLLFGNAVCFAHLCFYQISSPVMRIMLTWWTLFKSSLPILRKLYIRFTVALSNFSKLQFVSHILAFTKFLLRCYAHHANYGKHSLNHHFQHCAHSVYQIYSVLKLFEIAFCFAHFGFYEISTPVMGPMETVVNIVQVIISDIGFYEHPVVMRIIAIYGKNSLNHHLQHWAHSVYQIYFVLKLFKIWVCFAHFGCLRNMSTPVSAHDANYCKHCLTHHFQ